MPQDSEVRFFLIMGIVLFFLLFVFIIFIVVFYYKRQVQFLKERQEIKAQFEQEMLKAQLEIREQTLLNISQEIHDNIGQTLSLAKLNLNTLEMDNRRAEKLDNTKELVSKALIDLRSLSKTLNADNIVSAGLMKAIEYELGIVARTGAFKTNLEINGTITRLNAQKELILFRIVQESINNIIKHSQATAMNVVATYTATHLYLIIEDDGTGFLAEDATFSMETGQGLRNMKSRAALIGGNLLIESTPNAGTKITITTPTNEK